MSPELEAGVDGVAAGGGCPDVFGVEDAHAIACEHVAAGQSPFERAGVVNFLIVERDGHAALVQGKKAVEQFRGLSFAAGGRRGRVRRIREIPPGVFSRTCVCEGRIRFFRKGVCVGVGRRPLSRHGSVGLGHFFFIDLIHCRKRRGRKGKEHGSANEHKEGKPAFFDLHFQNLCGNSGDITLNSFA